MRIVIQRVLSARVDTANGTAGAIGPGLLVLVGVAEGDTDEDALYLARKTAGLRIFDDAEGVMNRSLADTGGEALVVSQFILMGSTRKGNRPSWQRAAGHELAVPLYERYCTLLSQAIGRRAERGVFGADMRVSLVNDGPVTLVIDSRLRE